LLRPWDKAVEWQSKKLHNRIVYAWYLLAERYVTFFEIFVIFLKKSIDKKQRQNSIMLYKNKPPGLKRKGVIYG
jgi:hypothetical protein